MRLLFYAIGLAIFFSIVSCKKNTVEYVGSLNSMLAIQDIFPKSGGSETVVKIKGTGFKEDVIVKFNQKDAKILHRSDKELLVEVPTAAGSGQITLELGNQLLEGPSFDYVMDWAQEADSSEWLPRDSHGGVVFDDRLWILGGWFNSFDTAFRDIWSSLDGNIWNLEKKVAPWQNGDLPMAIVFKNKIWLMGGANKGRSEDNTVNNEIWASNNGMDWQLEKENAEWTPRYASAIVEFKDRLWIFGGLEGKDKIPKNDVWYSEDGKNWMLANANAPWSARHSHTAVVLNGKMYLFGGGVYSPTYEVKQDVWSSDDGVNWSLVTDNAPWEGRLWPCAVIYRNRIWIMGGWSNGPYKNWNDVWYSEDGKTWKKFKTKAIWSERHAASAYVFQDKIWIAGGNADPLTNDVWSLKIPINTALD